MFISYLFVFSLFRFDRRIYFIASPPAQLHCNSFPLHSGFRHSFHVSFSLWFGLCFCLARSPSLAHFPLLVSVPCFPSTSFFLSSLQSVSFCFCLSMLTQLLAAVLFPLQIAATNRTTVSNSNSIQPILQALSLFCCCLEKRRNKSTLGRHEQYSWGLELFF